MMPVRLNRLGILVSGQHHAVSGGLKPEAQAAGATEKVCCQMSALGPETSRVGQECLLVLTPLWMSGQADERAPNQLDTVVAALGHRRPVSHTPSSVSTPAA